MGNPTRRLTRFLGIGSDSRGITGLETAIVLIAFVVVSSVFAFAALSTGLFSSDKSKETIRAGLDEASGTLEIRGVVMAKGLVVTNEAVIADDEAGQTGSLASTPVVDGSQTIADPRGGNMTKVSSSPSAGEYTINLDTGLVTIGVDADALGTVNMPRLPGLASHEGLAPYGTFGSDDFGDGRLVHSILD